MSLRSLALAGAAALLAACSESTAPAGVTMQSVAGSYSAAPATAGGSAFGALTFTTTATGATTDQLASGARLQLTLAPGGATSGRLVIPDDGAEEGLDADLAGTWTLSGTTVRLQHAADTFLRDMPLTASGNQLTGDATFSGVRVRLVMQRP